jgi:hypothetical protein
VRLFERTKAAGAIRFDIEVGDVSLLLEQLAAVRVADEERTRQLRHRYLALLLDALHAPSGTQLPGPPPGWEEALGDLELSSLHPVRPHWLDRVTRVWAPTPRTHCIRTSSLCARTFLKLAS